MALPASGEISFNQINVELGWTGTNELSMNGGGPRQLANVLTSGSEIAMSNFYSKDSIPVQIVTAINPWAGAYGFFRGNAGSTEKDFLRGAQIQAIYVMRNGSYLRFGLDLQGVVGAIWTTCTVNGGGVSNRTFNRGSSGYNGNTTWTVDLLVADSPYSAYPVTFDFA